VLYKATEVHHDDDKNDVSTITANVLKYGLFACFDEFQVPPSSRNNKTQVLLSKLASIIMISLPPAICTINVKKNTRTLFQFPSAKISTIAARQPTLIRSKCS
jgi:hypothetical protein